MIQLSKPVIGKEEKANLLKVLNSGLLARGGFVDKFEASFAKYTGARFAISTSNGTTALHAALLALGIKKGDVVITTPFSFIATSNSILQCGARIKFADIEALTYNISPEEIEKTLKRGKRVKAIVITHLYGLPCRMDAIMKIVKKYGLPLLEDCAQAHGAEFKGKKVGSFGNIAIFSFYGSKNMTTGEGGMITTSDKNLDKKCRCLIDQGRSSRFIHSELGFNYRMSNIAAAIGAAQLKKIDTFNKARIENAGRLTRAFNKISWLRVPFVPKDVKHVFHLYALRVCADRDGFVSYLNKKGVAAASNYPLPIYKQPVYKKLGYSKTSLKNAESASREIVNIPVHPALTKRDLGVIIKTVKSWKK